MPLADKAQVNAILLASGPSILPPMNMAPCYFILKGG
jgi:hypothetical protein